MGLKLLKDVAVLMSQGEQIGGHLGDAAADCRSRKIPFTHPG